MVFAGYKIKGIDANRVPAEYQPGDTRLFAVYLELEWNTRDFDDGKELNANLNAELINLWIDKFNDEVSVWLEEDDDIVLPDGIQPKIEYDRPEHCLRVENIALEDVEGIAEPLKGFIDHINEYIEDELDKRQEFRDHAEAINAEYFGKEEETPEIPVQTLWSVGEEEEE